MDLQSIHESIKTTVLDIGKRVKNELLGMTHVQTKKHERDLVTNVDTTVQALLKEKILELMPNTIVFGEESKESLSDFDIPSLWIIDPIDGTSNFVKQRRDYAIMLAYFEHLEPKLSYIYDVEADILYSAMVGDGVYVNNTKIQQVNNIGINQSLASIFIRKFYEVGSTDYQLLVKEVFDVRFGGSLGLDGARVATGQFGAFISPRIAPWDFAPFFLLAKELDLHLSDFDGKSLDLNYFSSIIFSTKQFFEDWQVLKNTKS